MYICIYVYMYICLYVYMYICTYIHIHVHTYIYMYIYIYLNNTVLGLDMISGFVLWGIYIYCCFYLRDIDRFGIILLIESYSSDDRG